MPQDVPGEQGWGVVQHDHVHLVASDGVDEVARQSHPQVEALGATRQCSPVDADADVDVDVALPMCASRGVASEEIDGYEARRLRLLEVVAQRLRGRGRAVASARRPGGWGAATRCHCGTVAGPCAYAAPFG